MPESVVSQLAVNTLVWQRWLSAHRFGPLVADGHWGPKTERAYLAWNAWFNHAGKGQGENGPFNGQFPLARIRGAGSDGRKISPPRQLPGETKPLPPVGAPPESLFEKFKSFAATPLGLVTLGLAGFLIFRGRGGAARLRRRSYARR